MQGGLCSRNITFIRMIAYSHNNLSTSQVQVDIDQFRRPLGCIRACVSLTLISRSRHLVPFSPPCIFITVPGESQSARTPEV